MKPRTVHLLILALLCLGPVGFGGFLAVKGQASHSELSPIALVAGLALIGVSAVYAGVSSALVWKYGSTPGRVAGVHGAIIAVAGVLFVGSRLLGVLFG